jgi:hypothetical protein
MKRTLFLAALFILWTPYLLLLALEAVRRHEYIKMNLEPLEKEIK